MIRILIFFCFFSFSYSQFEKDEITISSVKVNGNLTTSEKTIVFTAGLREGQTISPADFPRAIKRLWQLGLFQDVQIQYEEETKDGLAIIIEVVENFILGDIRFAGNKKIKDRKFDDEISLSTGQRIKLNTLHNTEKSIRKIYAEKGYLNVKISSELSMPKKDLSLFGGKGKELIRDLTFTIEENRKVFINFAYGIYVC